MESVFSVPSSEEETTMVRSDRRTVLASRVFGHETFELVPETVRSPQSWGVPAFFVISSIARAA